LGEREGGKEKVGGFSSLELGATFANHKEEKRHHKEQSQTQKRKTVFKGKGLLITVIISEKKVRINVWTHYT